MSTADFIERRWLRDWSDQWAMQRDAADELKARGAVHARFHIKAGSGELVAEGWRVTPKDEGDLPI